MEPILELIQNLKRNGPNLNKTIEKIMRYAVQSMNDIEELREELKDLEEIYDIIIIDAAIDFALEISNGKITYKKKNDVKAPVTIFFTKELILKILKGEVKGSVAYLKGEIKIRGDLSQGLRFMRLFRAFFNYMTQKRSNIHLS